MSKLPRLIALCGNPGSGKSTVQKILCEEFSYLPVDDGYCLRDFAMRHCGLTHDQVYTQAGKLETVEIAGKKWIVRDFLGQLGNRVEDLMGPMGIPFMAVTSKNPDHYLSFGSVRRDQGAYYKSLGGIVIEIANPDAGPSAYEFDRYDASLVDYVIANRSPSYHLHFEDAMQRLRQQVRGLMARIERERA